jgi:hypothetical protein
VPGHAVAASLGTAAAEGISALALKGNLQATELVDGDVHHLVGTGTGTHLGRFTYTADITVNSETGDGAGSVTWTAANGDEISSITAGQVVLEDFPNIGIKETQTITGGTGRFAGASGQIIVERSLDLLTGATTGSFTGPISFAY